MKTDQEILKKPELLAPAGDYASFLGAVSAGCDAVYLAGGAYGARAYARNLTKEEILDALMYAHIHNVRIYLTVNTITKPEEGRGLYAYLLPFYMAGLDGVIVQDLGVFDYIRRYFPDLPIHVSTQMCVTSHKGAAFLKARGAARVVPARELTLNEVQKIGDLGIETECFIHGSMCYSYSGQCLFSSFLGGRSGNRGRCAGPCRQPYRTDPAGGEKYLLSLKDMCTIRFLPKLIDAGITSFKIEGRMKSPAYAAGSTKIYRKYIDLYCEHPKEPYRVSEDDLKELTGLYLRTDLQKGYYEQTKSASMISLASPAYNKTDERLSVSLEEEYCRKKRPVTAEASLELITDSAAKLTVYDGDDPLVIVKDTVQPAKSAPLTKESIDKCFAKSSGGNFHFKITDLKLSVDAFLPLGALNALRREAEEKLEERKSGHSERRLLKDPSDVWTGTPMQKDYRIKPFVVFVQTKEQLAALLPKLDKKDILTIPLSFADDETIIKTLASSGNTFRIALPMILRSDCLDGINERMKITESLAFIEGYYADSVDAYAYLRDETAEKDIFGDIHLYIGNPLAEAFFGDSLKAHTSYVEYSFNEIRSFEKNGEFFIYGRLPLMNTANCIKNTLGKCSKTPGFVRLKDRIGADFTVFTHCEEKICYNTIYNSVPVSLHKQYPEYRDYAFQAFQIRFTDENADRTLSVYDAFGSLREGNEPAPAYDYTKGHYVKSVL